MSKTRSDSRHLGQLRSCAAALDVVYAAVFKQRRPADRTLAHYFRTHRQIGAREPSLHQRICFFSFKVVGLVRTVHHVV